MNFLSLFFTTIFSLSVLIALSAQVPVENLEKKKYPAGNKAESLEAAAVHSFFEETNVGNLHVFPSAETPASYNFFFKGEKLPQGAMGIFTEEWRENLPDSFDAYAVYAVKGEAKPYYIVRFEGEDIRNTIELFEMIEGRMEHRQTLAMYRCENGECVQQDAWLLDLNGDTLFDLIKKVKIWNNDQRERLLGEYQDVMTQLDNGRFVSTGSLEVDLQDYRMEELDR